MENSSTGIPACAHVTTSDDRATWHKQDIVPFAVAVSAVGARHAVPERDACHGAAIHRRQLFPFCKEAPIGLASKSKALKAT
jgi:hypothetical protein